MELSKVVASSSNAAAVASDCSSLRLRSNQLDVERYLLGPARDTPLPFFQTLLKRTSLAIREQVPNLPLWSCLFEADENAQVKWLDRQLQDNNKCLNKNTIILQGEDDLPLTPMLIIVWRGHVKALEILLNHKIPVKRDSKGWTEVHWAALTANPALLSVFQQHKYKLDWKALRTKWGARPVDLLKASHLPQAVQVTIDGGATFLDAKQYQNALGARYSPYAVWNPEALAELRLHPPMSASTEGFKQLHTHLTEQIMMQLTGGVEPWFAIAPISQDDNGCDISEKMPCQHEARAVRTIPLGTALCLYAGETYVATEEYGLAKNGKEMILSGSLPSHIIDAGATCNGAEFLNHGAPTCDMRTIIVHGIPRRVIFALRRIEKGEALRLNYCPEFIEGMGDEFVELGSREIQQYVQETRGLTLIPGFTIKPSPPPRVLAVVTKSGEPILGHYQISQESLLKEQIKCLRHSAMLTYILHHPKPLAETLKAGASKTHVRKLVDLFESKNLVDWFCQEPAKIRAILH